jgi:hypothetical protein
MKNKNTTTPQFKSRIPNTGFEETSFHLYSVNKTGKKLKWKHINLFGDLNNLQEYRDTITKEDWFIKKYLPEFKIVKRTITKQTRTEEID